MRKPSIFICLFVLCIGNACERHEDTLPEEISGYITYSVNGQQFTYDQYGVDCSIAATYSGITLTGIEITGGSTVGSVSNTISISDYQADITGTYDISTVEVEQENYIITGTFDNMPFSMYWGEGLGVQTGSGTITYTVFQPSATTAQMHLEGTFSFYMYNLLNEEIEVTGSFSF